MADLITLAEYKQYDTTTPSSDDTFLSSLITGASDLVERHCNRTFASTSYDEVLDGTGYRLLELAHFPIISIDRVACNPRTVLTVRNTSTSVSRATVRVTSTGLTLVSVASAVTTTTALAFATYTTLSALATAVAAVSGWTATVQAGYETYPSADLRAVQGALNAKLTDAPLVLHTDELSDFAVIPETGELDRPACWYRGVGNFRIVYTANFASVPEDIKQACRELVKAGYNARRLDPGLVSQDLGAWKWTKVTDAAFGNLSLLARNALARYRIVRIPRFRQEGTTWRR